MKSLKNIALFLLFSIGVFLVPFELKAESFRSVITGTLDVSQEQDRVLILGINDSALINLGANTRFLRGIEIELTAPQAWLQYHGSVVMAVYNNLNHSTAIGVSDIVGNRIGFEPLPAKLQIVYQIPLRPAHGLRTTHFATVATDVIPASSFPILFRLAMVVKGMGTELENMVFNFSVRPIFSNEGAVRFIPRYPPQLRDKPFTLLVNDVVIENITEELVLREGENHMVILSEDYRNESRRFVVERAKTLDLVINLQDPTPLIIFEGPQNASVFLNNAPVARDREIQVEPGLHEARFQIGDYTVTRTLNIQRGKTYRIALSVDLVIQEIE